MPRITFIQSTGVQQTLDVAEGSNAMLMAMSHSVDGILGDCGGNLSCATCHVFVDGDSLHRLAPMTPAEDQMLDFTAAARRPDSRLSCQIKVSADMDGLCLTIADPQV